MEIENLYVNKRVLAPLVGGSDLSYRLLCRKYGAELTYTEMCIADVYLNSSIKKKKSFLFEFDESDRPLIVQLAGNNAEYIIKMANLPMFVGKIDGIDINCGCPQGFAMEKGIGAGMLKNADHLVNMCREIVPNIPYPLSVKLRIHEDVPTTINIMQRLYDVGVKAFTVHGREYWQRGEKRGVCNWEAIRQIKNHFQNVPITGNGDVCGYEQFNDFQNIYGVDSVMSGYGALLNPTLFGPNPLPLNQVIQDYLNISYKHENKWIDILRHLAWLLKPLSLKDKSLKANLFQCKTYTSIRYKIFNYNRLNHKGLLKFSWRRYRYNNITK